MVLYILMDNKEMTGDDLYTFSFIIEMRRIVAVVNAAFGWLVFESML